MNSTGSARPRPPGPGLPGLPPLLDSAAGRGVLVAVVDSGWDRRRPESRVRRGYSVVHSILPFVLQSSQDDQDRLGHGTRCASIILSVAPAVEVLPIRVFGQTRETSVGALVRALELAAEHKVHVVNLSLATIRRDAVLPLYAACEWAGQAGAIIVAAAANDSPWSYPAVFAHVISVRAAREREGALLEYRDDDAVECAVNLHSSAWAAVPELWEGSSNSQAAAAVSGLVALILEHEPGADLVRVRKWLARVAGFDHSDPRQPAS